MINIVGVTISTLIMRWLLQLSTIEKDIQWICRTKMWKSLTRLQFYQGAEYLHQIRGKRIVDTTTSN